MVPCRGEESSGNSAIVLNRKQSKQCSVDKQSLSEWSLRSGINGLWHEPIPKEADRIQKRSEKDQITDCPVDKHSDAFKT